MASNNDCPSCGQRNDAEMLFCIYCGSSMKGTETASTTAPSQLSSGPSVICPNCGQVDALNRQFCVFCGARTDKRSSHSRINSAIVAVQQGLEGNGKPSKSQEKGVSSLLGPTIAAALLLGIGAGAGIAYLMNNQPLDAEAQASRNWPPSGLVVYSNPNTDVEVRWSSGDIPYYRVGKTGPTGALVFKDLDPNKEIKVRVSDDHGQKLTAVDLVKHKRVVVGFPQRFIPD